MIYGIGNDIIEIDRIKNSLNRNLKLIEKLFSEQERAMLKEKSYKAESIAGNFCAKEAVVKAVGTGLRGFRLHDVQILRNDLGKPVVVPCGKFKDFLDEKNITDILVTISHSKNYATATAIAVSE